MGPGGCRLTGRFGDLDIAEEAAAEAFATAVQRWPTDDVPPNPGAWLTIHADNPRDFSAHAVHQIDART